MLEKICSKCKAKDGDIDEYCETKVRFYNEDGISTDGKKELCETMLVDELTPFCDSCVDNESRKWWEEESKAYIFDDFGNTPDDDEYCEENL